MRASVHACECACGRACVFVLVREKALVLLLLRAKYLGVGSVFLGWLEWA